MRCLCGVRRWQRGEEGEPEVFASASAGSESSTCSQIAHIQGRIPARGRPGICLTTGPAQTDWGIKTCASSRAQDGKKDLLTEERLTLLQKACQFLFIFFSDLTFFKTIFGLNYYVADKTKYKQISQSLTGSI